VKDTKLNISAAYLRPGLPFGGSCLPKDLRMLAQLGARVGFDLPLLDGTLASNEAHLKRTVNAVPNNGRPRIGLDGLAFKPGTDDLRESPIVLIAEHLIGKGYDLKIYDPVIETSLLAGTNREYIEAHLPHLSSRLVHKLDELVDHADVVLLARDVEPVLLQIALSGKHPTLIDLRGENHLPDKLRQAQARVQAQFSQPAQPEIPGALDAKPSAAFLSALCRNTRTNLAPSHAQ
jgi:GDP-mannose 6-dehydrogenase